MDKFTYFTSALHAGCAGRTHWVTSCFSAMTHEVYDPGKHKLADDDAPKLIRDQAVTYQFRIFRFNKDSHEVGFIHRENEEVKLVSLGELKPMASIFSFTEKTMVNNTVIPTAPEQAIETTYGNILVNWLLFFLPFGLKIPFQTGKLDGGKCDDLVNEKYARSLPKKGEERDPKLIYVDEYLKYQKNASYLDSWSNFATASATLAGLSPNPEVAKFIKTKLKELGHPPSVSELAAIEEQAAKLDKDLFKGTEDENFIDHWGNEHKIRCFDSKENLLNELLQNNINEIYFDIDLDYFTESNDSCGGGEDLVLMDDQDILSLLNIDSEFMQWIFKRMEGMTIATEPKWCGGLINSNKIYKILDNTLFNNQLFSKKEKWKHLT